MTVKQVEALKAEKKPYKRSVDTGLMMRVSASGIKTWIVQYVVDGVQRDYALPKPWGQNSDEAHMSLADARRVADHRGRAPIDGQDRAVDRHRPGARREIQRQAVLDGNGQPGDRRARAGQSRRRGAVESHGAD